MPAPTRPFATWAPEELGLPRATAASIVLVAAIVAFCYWASVMLAPKPKLQPIQVTQAQLTQLPAPTPPPPPKVVPPPKPLPAVIPKPLPVPSKIVVATKPPPVRHIYKPVQHPVVHHTAPPVPAAHPAPTAPQQPAHASPAPSTPAPPSNGIPIYGSEMHAILEQNQSVPPALATLGASGTAVIEVTVAPDGHVISAKVVHSSGIGLIDQTALSHALEAHFAAFSADMPSTPVTFDIPVNIQPQTDDSTSGSDSDSDNN